jgi:hypothetical protein
MAYLEYCVAKSTTAQYSSRRSLLPLRSLTRPYIYYD